MFGDIVVRRQIVEMRVYRSDVGADRNAQVGCSCAPDTEQ
jgi:hypothetical protein